MLNLVKTALEDVQQAFEIEEDLFEKFFPEIISDTDLKRMIDERQNFGDWTQKTPLGGPGTSLNAIVLYCLVRHYRINRALETGVSGGFYTTFLLQSLDKSNGDESELRSIDLSSDAREVGKLIPEEKRTAVTYFDLILGEDSLEHMRNKLPHRSFQLYCHDSLHEYPHMLAELQEFKKCELDQFFVYIDDQNSDDFWQRCLYLKLFNKPGYDIKCISGNESRLKGHLGGFVKYEKIDA